MTSCFIKSRSYFVMFTTITDPSMDAVNPSVSRYCVAESILESCSTMLVTFSDELFTVSEKDRVMVEASISRSNDSRYG